MFGKYILLAGWDVILLTEYDPLYVIQIRQQIIEITFSFKL